MGTSHSEVPEQTGQRADPVGFEHKRDPPHRRAVRVLVHRIRRTPCERQNHRAAGAALPQRRRLGSPRRHVHTDTQRTSAELAMVFMRCSLLPSETSANSGERARQLPAPFGLRDRPILVFAPWSLGVVRSSVSRAAAAPNTRLRSVSDERRHSALWRSPRGGTAAVRGQRPRPWQRENSHEDHRRHCLGSARWQVCSGTSEAAGTVAAQRVEVGLHLLQARIHALAERHLAGLLRQREGTRG